MSMIVNHNIPALNANKNLYTANRGLDSSLAKLSSGFRINTGSDGPADLVISEQLRSQITGLDRAVRNTTEAINVLSIAEGALNEMNSILKKMKALAIHSANSGITSPDQVAADQAEMDSGIQTLERIANTTKFSDQFLLNGAKDITYAVDTNVKGTQNNRLVNTGFTNFQQIFKRDGYQVSIGFNGAVGANSVTNIGNAAMGRQAAKAYLEIDAYDGTVSQVDKNGYLTKGQSFILTGTLGSRQFRFSEGAHISDMVTAINNVAGSTGIDASLTFNRNQQINVANAAAAATKLGMTTKNANSAMTIYDNYTVQANGAKAIIATAASITGGCVVFGKNTDGQGFIYVKLLGNGASGNVSYELYKDASLSRESLIGSGISGTTDSKELNNSGLKMQIAISNGKYGDVLRISTGNVALNSCNVTVNGVGACVFAACKSTAAGVRLGVNTSSDGKIYFKTVYGNDGKNAMIYAYNNSLMRDQDMVAKTANAVDMSAGTTNSVVLDSILNDEKTANTGLGITLALKADQTGTNQAKKNTTETMEMQFNNLGARIASGSYGSDQYIKVQMFDGGIFVDYQDASNYDSATLIDGNSAYEKRGQDATVTVNGQQMKTKGLNMKLATPDIMANITFNAGKTGSTTLAQVGYTEGSIFNKATSLTFAFSSDYSDTGSNSSNNSNYSGLLNNAGHVTSERISSFQGGMQLQLGEGSGDQERTVIGIKSMSTAQLGRIEVTKKFDPSKAIVETKTLSIQDVMGGQLASLSNDPVLAMKIIDKAVNDVSEARATIGAVQANMLQTNENNLRVAIENITKTEAGIRDTDMASEMTEFTKFQILANADISMLAQANSQAQSVLALIGR